MKRTDGYSAPWSLLRPLGDLAAGIGAFLGAFLLRIYLPLPFTLSLLPSERLHYFATDWWVVAVAQPLVLYFFGFYDPPEPGSRSELPRRLAAATGLQGLGLMGYYFLTSLTFPRTVLLVFAVLNFSLLFVWRALVLRFHSPPQRRVAIVGRSDAARELAGAIRSFGWHGLTVVGHVPAPEEDRFLEDASATGPEEGSSIDPLGPCLGTVDDLPSLFDRGEVEEVILASDVHSWQTQLMDRLADAGPRRGSVLLLPGPFESLIGRMRYRWVQDLPLIEVIRQTEWRVNRPLKRGLDLLVGSLLLLLALPIMLLCAATVRLTSKGPVLYEQTRVGIGQRPFSLRKFRTMRQDAEQTTGEVLAQPGDPRLTSVGGFLRRYRLDELPQLFNVLGGTMSLVGPRPERPGFVKSYLEEIPGYAERFSLQPGLTGLAQINGHYHSSAANKLRYDLAYLANWSLWLDLSILLRTVKIVLTSQGT
ncbi:MAG: sugar transferase [Acidobacteria bacterium]|nr:sugar transferase [Acidobacteriota bacterium]